MHFSTHNPKQEVPENESHTDHSREAADTSSSAETEQPVSSIQTPESHSAADAQNLIALKRQKHCHIYLDTKSLHIRKYFHGAVLPDQESEKHFAPTKLTATAEKLKQQESVAWHQFNSSEHIIRLVKETDEYFEMDFWNRGDLHSIYMDMRKKGESKKNSSNVVSSHHFYKKDTEQLENWDVKLKIASQLARGLRTIHQKGFIHGDIKSANVLLNDEWEACWCDFAFARNLMEGSSSFEQRGTIFWMPPELLRIDDKATQDFSSDVFSFGVILWELTTLKRPYPGMNSFDVSQKVPRGYRMEIPSDTPLSDLIERSWRQEMNERPTIDQICQELENLYKVEVK